jgi:hypothetical protein
MPFFYYLVYSSVQDNIGLEGAEPTPPKARPAVCDPAPPNLSLPHASDPPVDHATPLYSSVDCCTQNEGKNVAPPKTTAAF